MGRPRLYERETTLERAVALFRRQGFSGTTTRDLEQTLDLRPGSLYRQFGSKEGLYRQALEHFASHNQALLDGAFEDARDVFDGLDRYLRQCLQRPGEPGCTECFLTRTALDSNPRHAGLRREARRLLEELRGRILSRLERARARGEIDPDVDLSRLACFIQAQVTGLRILAQMAQQDAALDALRADALAAIRAQAGGGAARAG